MYKYFYYIPYFAVFIYPLPSPKALGTLALHIEGGADDHRQSGRNDNRIDATIDAAEEICDPLDGLVEKTATDPGAPFAPDALGKSLAALKKRDRSAFEALRARLKKAGCRVTVLDDAISEENGDSPDRWCCKRAERHGLGSGNDLSRIHRSDGRPNDSATMDRDRFSGAWCGPAPSSSCGGSGACCGNSITQDVAAGDHIDSLVAGAGSEQGSPTNWDPQIAYIAGTPCQPSGNQTCAPGGTSTTFQRSTNFRAADTNTVGWLAPWAGSVNITGSIHRDAPTAATVQVFLRHTSYATDSSTFAGTPISSTILSDIASTTDTAIASFGSPGVPSSATVLLLSASDSTLDFSTDGSTTVQAGDELISAS